MALESSTGRSVLPVVRRELRCSSLGRHVDLMADISGPLPALHVSPKQEIRAA